MQMLFVCLLLLTVVVDNFSNMYKQRFCGANVLYICLSHLGSRIKPKKFKLPYANFTTEVLQKLRRKTVLPEMTNPSKKGNGQRFWLRGTMRRQV